MNNDSSKAVKKVVQKGQPGVLAVTLPSTSQQASVSQPSAPQSQQQSQQQQPQPQPQPKPRIPMPKAHFEHYPIRSQVANFAASSNDKSAKKKHIFSIPGPNAVIDFAALQARKRPKKPNKLKLGILHDRVEHYSDPARVDAALEQWDRDAATRCAQLIAVDQDIVDTHARVSTAQCAIAVALRPFAMFLAAQAPCNLVVAGDERFHVTRPLSASLDTILVAYRKHRRVLRKLLDSRTGATTLEPFDITGELVSIQTPPVSESIEEMCALRVAFSTNAIAWHVRLFDAYEAVIARFTESLHSAIKRVPDRIVVAVTGDELTTLRDTLNELERGYVAYARHAIVFDRSIAEISEIPAERELVIEQQRRSVLALQNSQAKLDQKLAVLKATSDDNDNSAKTNANDGADDDNDDDDNDNDEVAVVVDDETPPMPEDFKALELALKSESVVAFYRKLQRFPAVEPAPRASYVTIEPTEELMSAVVAILNRLDRLQVRGKKSGAVRAKRLDIGMHATRMRLEARSAFAIVLATDIEPVRTLLDEIAALQALAHRRRVPVICMMTRRELATAVNRQNDAVRSQIESGHIKVPLWYEPTCEVQPRPALRSSGAKQETILTLEGRLIERLMDRHPELVTVARFEAQEKIPIAYKFVRRQVELMKKGMTELGSYRVLHRELEATKYRRLIERLVSTQTAMRAGKNIMSDESTRENLRNMTDFRVEDQHDRDTKFTLVLEALEVRRKRKDPTQFSSEELAAFGLANLTEQAAFCIMYPFARRYFDEHLQYGGLADIDFNHPQLREARETLTGPELTDVYVQYFRNGLSLPVDKDEFLPLSAIQRFTPAEIEEEIDELEASQFDEDGNRIEDDEFNRFNDEDAYDEFGNRYDQDDNEHDERDELEEGEEEDEMYERDEAEGEFDERDEEEGEFDERDEEEGEFDERDEEEGEFDEEDDEEGDDLDEFDEKQEDEHEGVIREHGEDNDPEREHEEEEGKEGKEGKEVEEEEDEDDLTEEEEEALTAEEREARMVAKGAKKMGNTYFVEPDEDDGYEYDIMGEPELHLFLTVCEENNIDVAPGYASRVRKFIDTATMDQRADFVAAVLEMAHNSNYELRELTDRAAGSFDPYHLLTMNQVLGVDITEPDPSVLRYKLLKAAEESQVKRRASGRTRLQELDDSLKEMGVLDKAAIAASPADKSKK